MSRKTFTAFIADEEGSVAMEYLALVGVLSIGWVFAAEEYKRELIMLFDHISHVLRQVSLSDFPS